MDDLKRLALAALAHDLPQLMQRTETPVSADTQRVLDLASLHDEPALAAILDQAEAYATPEGQGRELVTDQALLSVFSRIQLSSSGEIKYHRFGPLPSTTVSQEGLFPVPASPASGLAAHVQALAMQLDWLGASVDMAQFERLYLHLMASLQRYGWCLPAHSRDVALCDHARLTSAIAVCLYRYHQDNLTLETVQGSSEAERFCLLVGDLTGIQDYVFAITMIGAGGVARRLRARSFYVSTLSETISHQVAHRFGVPLGNVIMSSGGKFYVLLPNLGDVEAKIQELRREIDRWFLEQFNGEIAVNLAQVYFAGDSLQASSQEQEGFGRMLMNLNLKLSREKRQRGQSVLAPGGRWDESAFVVERDFGGVGVCASCRKFPAERPDNLCDQCERDVQLGQRLSQVQYVAYYRHPADEDALPMPLSCSARVLTTDELEQAGQPYLLTKLNDPEIHELADQAGTFRYLANHVPLEGLTLLGFGEIAARAEGSPLLGYVKADVDHLGILLTQGLRRDEQVGYDTAAHVAALSRELDLFFSSWMQHLLSQTSSYRDFYTIFSGGDDVFLVGPWDKAAKLACKVNDALDSFAGGNPNVTLSAGVLFAKSRYPISHAAQDTEKALELSKNGRNQLTVLGDTLSWKTASRIFKQVNALKPSLRHLPSAFLHDLIEYWRLYRLWSKEQKTKGLRYKPLFAHNIARNLRTRDRALREWADDLMLSLHSDKPSLVMEHLGLVATLLLLAKQNRKHQENNAQKGGQQKRRSRYV